MTSTENDEDYRSLIFDSAKSLDYLDQFPIGNAFRWLANEIKNGKRNLKYDSVDFIVAKVLNRKEQPLNFQKVNQINIYVIGTFRSEFVPTMKVAEAFAEFYLEMRVLPNISTITKKEFLGNPKSSLNKIRNGVLIYDRERNIH